MEMVKSLLLILALSFILSGCRGAKVYEVRSAAFSVAKTKAQVHTAIHRALNKEGWSVIGETESTVTARYKKSDKYSAVIVIHYAEEYYSIVHKESKGLHYDGERIHKLYNGWILTLERRINTLLAAMRVAL